MHVVRADLHLDAMPLRSDDGGVQRAVAVGLGGRDVVLETPRHHRIAAVQQAERVVAVAQRADNHTEGHDVGKLRSEEHTSELQSLMRISYAVFCLKKKKPQDNQTALIQQNTTWTHQKNTDLNS